MENTVVGVFDNYSDAQSAQNEMISRGIGRDNVRLSPEAESTDARQSALRSDNDPDDSWSIGKFFRDLFGSDEDPTHADVYSEAVRRGSYLLTVDAATEAQREMAVDILNKYDPVDIDERSTQWRSQGWSSYDHTSAPYSDEEILRERSMYSTPRGAQSSAQMQAESPTAGGRMQSQNQMGGTLEGEARIPVIEEQMKIGKREVQRGGVRVYQRVTEKPVNESVQLREEHVNVERRPVDKPASAADLAAFKEGSIELRETAEEAVVEKTARVVEEVLVNKEVSERTENIDDTVRRTDVEVEQLGRQPGSATGKTGTRDVAGTAGTYADDSDFRNHWQTNYGASGGTYDDYSPAYRYGSTLGSNQAYRGKRWDDIEPQIRSDWESKNAGSPWEKVKDAVRHSWEKVTRP